MDFFEAQARARKRTSRLIILFGFAVVGTIAAGYLAAAVVLQQVSPRTAQLQSDYWNYQRSGTWTGDPVATRWWDPRLFGTVALGTLAVVSLASLYKWSQFHAGGSAVAESVGGRRIDQHTTDLNERRLLNVVEEMAIASGTPVPAVYVLPDETGINAFAAGLTTSDAVVAVTRGTLEKLNRDELQGVVAHEFSHILNGDMRMNLRIAAIVFGILVLGLAGRGILWSMRRMRGSRGKGSGGAMAAFLLIGLSLMIVGYVGYFFGRMIQAAVSRQREFLADASAVQFTRNPDGIKGALMKIGGYALGSLVASNKSTEIGHFFFAQGFRTGITGLWATHPPLDERLRAIDPAFDGKMFEPPQLVDVQRESFQGAGFHGGARHTADETARRVFSAPARVPSAARPRETVAFRPAAAMAAIGTVTPEHLDRARRLIEEMPPRLHAAAHAPDEAGALVYSLLLDDDSALRSRQREIVARAAGAASAQLLDQLEPARQTLGPEQKLPLLQVALPTLKRMPAAELATFLETLDELVHADAKVSTFEFALQKLLIHTLALGRDPAGAGISHHSLGGLAGEVSILLSAMARAAVRDPSLAPRAFAAGAAQLRLIEDRLRFRSDADFAALDQALDQLARASLPIKQQALFAAGHVVSADGQVQITELELLRAVAAALDCPMPPLATGLRSPG